MNLTLTPFPKLPFQTSLVFVESVASYAGMKLAWRQANNLREASMKIKKPLLIATVSVLAILLLGGTLINNSLVVTDPDDPRFEIKNFRFENYSETNNHFKRSIEKMFPPGTDRAYVEQILVTQGGAEGGKNQQNRRIPPEHGSYTYRWPPRGIGGWLVNFIFDENDKSIMMTMGAKPIYGTDPVYEWIQERKAKRRERYGQ